MFISEGEEVAPSISEVLGPELTQKLLDINLKPNEFTPEVYSATLEMLEPFVVLVEGNSTPVGAELALRRQLTLIEAGYILGYQNPEEQTEPDVPFRPVDL